MIIYYKTRFSSLKGKKIENQPPLLNLNWTYNFIRYEIKFYCETEMRISFQNQKQSLKMIAN